MYRVGTGFDVHKFEDVEKRPLLLGGIEIPFEKGLKGHSDADVVLHALCDALLGAVGKGDIGEYFPDTDPKYQNISSSLLLKQVNDAVQEQGYVIENVDIVIHADAPKLQEFKKQMRFHIAYELAIDEGYVNVKATTHEGLGFIGRKEGIAASANVLVKKTN